MNKIYIIRYEEFDDNNGTSSGVSYIYSDKEQALEKFKMIKQEVVEFAIEEERDYEVIEETNNYKESKNVEYEMFLIQYGCGSYEEYVLEERNVI